MSIIWIVEKAKPDGAAQALIGDYAVRVFASPRSFATLVRLGRQPEPDAVVIDAEDTGLDAKAARAMVAASLGGTPLVLLCADDSAAPQEGDGVHTYRKPVDGLHLSTFLRFACGRRRRPQLRYRDLLLDVEGNKVLVVPGDEIISLPLKEAQILRRLMGRPGECQGRDELTQEVWDGVKVAPRTLDSHVSRLRQRLKKSSVAIESVYGGGYVLR